MKTLNKNLALFLHARLYSLVIVNLMNGLQSALLLSLNI
jgi:hypothetical protein